MRFYLVTHHTEGGVSAGFSWHTSKVEARRQVAERNWPVPERSEFVGPIDIEPTKRGILHALNYYAAHPDNG